VENDKSCLRELAGFPYADDARSIYLGFTPFLFISL